MQLNGQVEVVVGDAGDPLVIILDDVAIAVVGIVYGGRRFAGRGVMKVSQLRSGIIRLYRIPALTGCWSESKYISTDQWPRNWGR